MPAIGLGRAFGVGQLNTGSGMSRVLENYDSGKGKWESSIPQRDPIESKEPD